MIAMVEQDMVKKLGFNLNYTTSLEFIMQILFLDNYENLDRYSQIQNLIE